MENLMTKKYIEYIECCRDCPNAKDLPKENPKFGRTQDKYCEELEKNVPVFHIAADCPLEDA